LAHVVPAKAVPEKDADLSEGGIAEWESSANMRFDELTHGEYKVEVRMSSIQKMHFLCHSRHLEEANLENCDLPRTPHQRPTLSPKWFTRARCWAVWLAKRKRR